MNEEAPISSFRIPKVNKKIFNQGQHNAQNPESAYSTVSLPTIERDKFSKINHQNYQSEFNSIDVDIKEQRIPIKENFDGRKHLSRKNKG